MPAIRRIVILTDTDNLGENLGRLLSADVFGFAMGPAVSALLVSSLELSLASPFIVVAALTLILLPLTRQLDVEERVDESGQRLAVDLLRSRVVAGAVVLAAGVFLMIGAFDAIWDVVHEDLGTPEWMANLGITLILEGNPPPYSEDGSTGSRTDCRSDARIRSALLPARRLAGRRPERIHERTVWT